MMLKQVTAKGLERMAEDAVKASAMLGTAKVDLLLYGCTSGSLIKGKEWEAKLVSDLSRETGIPVISTSGAVVEALRELEINHVGLATPYIEELNWLEKKFQQARAEISSPSNVYLLLLFQKVEANAEILVLLLF
jgi:maleate isomerase